MDVSQVTQYLNKIRSISKEEVVDSAGTKQYLPVLCMHSWANPNDHPSHMSSVGCCGGGGHGGR